ncbi:MAG: hypothetical protein ACU0B7_00390 [Paracoccaceae bacterium]
MEFLLPLFSVLLGLALLNSVVLLKSHTFSAAWFVGLPLEARYLTILSIILLVILNGNQWMPGETLFPLMAGYAVYLTITSLKQMADVDRKTLLRDGKSLISVQIITLFIVIFAYQTWQFFLLEFHNHDSLYYYQGSNWARFSRLFVDSETVSAHWGFEEGDTWIGYDRPLYRGGTYTLAAWMQHFSPHTTANGLNYLLVYSATMAWISVKLLTRLNMGVWSFFWNSASAVLVALSTGLIGALLNSNLATVMGGTSLMVVFAIALKSDLAAHFRYGLMAAWCAICTHFYGESVFYAGLLFFIVILIEFTRQKNRTLRYLASILILLASVVAVLGNIPFLQSIASLFLFTEIANGGSWFSLYLHKPNIAWLGSFVAGILIGHNVPHFSIVLSILLTTHAVIYLSTRRNFRSGLLALLIVSTLAVFYIEVSFYQYGEHKIIHLLGASWVLAIVVVGLDQLADKEKKSSSKLLFDFRTWTAVGAFICVALLNTISLSTSIKSLDQMRGTHSLDFGIGAATAAINFGDSVLIDDSEWVGVEKFLKTHYMVFYIQTQRAFALMPEIESDSLRGGYHRNSINNSLRATSSVDWLLKAKGSSLKYEKFLSPDASPVFENADFQLYYVGDEAVSVAGNGWYDCEQEHCWTRPSFEIESFVPTGGNYSLSMNFTVFSAPENGSITVRGDNGDVLTRLDAKANQVAINLQSGWSKLVFSPDWKISSPKELNMSEDSRNLFIAVESIKLIDLDGLGVEK